MSATDAGITGASAPMDRPKTRTELEMEEGARMAVRRAARLGLPPKKNDAAAPIIPFPLGEMIDTGIVPAVTAKQAQAAGTKREMPPGEQGAASTVTGPTGNTAVRSGGCTGPTGKTGPISNTGPTGTQPRPNVSQAKQSGTSLPKFDRAMALEFYSAVRPSAFILNFTQGRSITSTDAFQTLTKEADDKHAHLFFHVATIKPEWADPKTHEKGKITTASKDKAVNMPDGSATHVLECPYLWGDCDAEKYAGSNPVEAAKHYENEGSRVRTAIDNGLRALGITPFAIWRSGAGWQFLIKLDQAIQPDEAESLVGKLHTALGFDPIVRNCNRILRVPGSINWKNDRDGRVPSSCMPLHLADTVTKTDDVRKALASVAEPVKEAKASGATDIKIDWSEVKTSDGWLKSVDDMPVRATAKLRIIVGHSGNLSELNDQLVEAKLLDRAYSSWSEVTQAATACLKSCGLRPEQIAEALLADLPFNQHVERAKDKERAIERAISRSHSPTLVAVAGVKFRDCDKYGKPKPSLANAVIAIRALGIEASYDLFHHRIKVTYNGDSKTIHEGLLTDDTVSATRSLINNTYRIDCGDANTLAAIKEIALANAYDPVLDMLDNCQGKWDGVKRLDTWVIDYLGCENSPLNRAIGRLVLIAACRRARVAGCKFDNITVLEGVEGTNKSTAIRVLASDENFSDQSIIGARDKEVQEQLDGVWMHENADLAGMKRADVEQIKAFASRQTDRARPAYGRVREDRPRRSIEWGTTNNKEYLLSQTGNRRFWPLETGTIYIEALKSDREQLLGEAATYEAAGESISLDRSLWGDAREAQERRRVTDPWEDLLNDIGGVIVHVSGGAYERVASADVLTNVLGIPRAQQTSAHGQRLAHAMRHAGGWERPPSGRVTINGVPARGYIRSQHKPATVKPVPFEVAQRICDAALLGMSG